MSEFYQPKTEMDIKIEKAIVDETNKLNACVLNFLKENDYDEKDFTGCCNEHEKQLLIDCYNIFFPNSSSVDVDMDFIKALIAYYYNLIVFEHYSHEFINDNYLHVIREVPANDLNETNTKSIFGEKDLGFMVNDEYLYLYMYKEGDDDNDNMYNVINKLGDRYYIYKDWDEKDSRLYRGRNENGVGINPVKTSFGFECFINLVNTPRSKIIYNKLAFGDGDNLSKIRRTLLGFYIDQSVYEKEIAKVENVKVNNVKVDNVKGKNLKGKDYYDYWLRIIRRTYLNLDQEPLEDSSIYVLLNKYKGNEDELIKKIKKKYEKSAATAVPPPLPSQDSKNYKEIITALYQQHNPAKIDEIPTLLEKYKGQEEEMISKIKNKYEKQAATTNPTQKGGYKSYKGRKKNMKKNTKKYIKKNKRTLKKYIKKSRKK